MVSIQKEITKSFFKKKPQLSPDMLLKHLSGIIALPVAVLIIFPFLLTLGFDFKQLWGLDSITGTLILSLGLALIAFGLTQLIYTISIFISKGNGTIAPWAPTRNLIKTGIYGCVRNPMMIAVFSVLIGECSIAGSFYLVAYSGTFIIINLLYIPLIEERKLTNRFGEEYLKYKKEVPRWLPTKCIKKKFK